MILFGKDEDAQLLRAEHAAFAKALLLLAYTISVTDRKIIVDGNDPEVF